MSSDNQQLLAWAMQIVQQAQGTGMYGEVTVRMEAGKIVHVDKREGYKPPKAGMLAKESGVTGNAG